MLETAKLLRSQQPDLTPDLVHISEQSRSQRVSHHMRPVAHLTVIWNCSDLDSAALGTFAAHTFHLPTS